MQDEVGDLDTIAKMGRYLKAIQEAEIDARMAAEAAVFVFFLKKNPAF